MPFRPYLMLLTLGFAGLLAGCATQSSPIPPGSACEVTAARAQFYKYGPAQAFGADESLPQGTRVTMVTRDFGFSRVMLASGATGYVSTDELRPIPPEPKPKEKPERIVSNRKLPRLFSAPVKRSNVRPTPSEPLFDINDVPLPMSDTPPAKAPAKAPADDLPKP